MRIGSRAALAAVLMICAGSVQAGTEDDVKAQFSKFVAAQNAHDLKAVGETLSTRRSSSGSREGRLSGAVRPLSSGSRRCTRAHGLLIPRRTNSRCSRFSRGWPNSTSRSPS